MKKFKSPIKWPGKASFSLPVKFFARWRAGLPGGLKRLSLSRGQSLSFDRTQLIWLAWRWWHRLGVLGTASMAGLLFLIAAHLLFAHPRLQHAQQRLTDIRQELAQPMPSDKGRAGAGTNPIDDQLQAVFDVLRTHHLAAPEAQYRQSRSAANGQRQGRLSVELPLSGNYRELRAALTDISNLDGVRVDRLVMVRPALETERLSINVRISLGGGA